MDGKAAMKIGVFIDVQNIYYTVRQVFGRQFNYGQLWKRLNVAGEIQVANAYAIDKGDSQQIKFQSALRKMGYNVKLKPYIQRSDGSAKGDWDVGITIDVMQALSSIDHLVLLSGDGDFDRLLSVARDDYEVSTEVIAVSNLTAQSLVNAANEFSPIGLDLLM